MLIGMKSPPRRPRRPRTAVPAMSSMSIVLHPNLDGTSTSGLRVDVVEYERHRPIRRTRHTRPPLRASSLRFNAAAALAKPSTTWSLAPPKPADKPRTDRA